MVKPTIIDLAAHVGLDKATVSRALNDKPGVASQTRQRVKEAALQLNYQPNIHGQQLRNWQSRTLGLVLSANQILSLRFYGPLVLELVTAAAERNYDLLIVSPDRLANETIANVLIRKGIDSTLLIGEQTDDVLNSIHTANIAAVQTVLYSDTYPEISSVTTDDFAAVRQLTQCLIKLGHRHFGLIGNPYHISSFKNRYAGFQDALEEATLEEITVDIDRQHTEQYITALLQLECSPTALIGLSDSRAAQAIHVARKLGLEVPGDLSIIGFDDVNLHFTEGLDLTTVRINQNRIAQAAIEILLNYKKDAPAVQQLVLSEFIQRGTMGPPPKKSVYRGIVY